MGTQSTIAHITGVNSSMPAKWNNCASWSWGYYPSIPDELKLETTLRRAILERVEKSTDCWRQFWQKLSEYSSSDYTMYHAVTVPTATHEKEEAVAWFQTKSAFCHAFTGILSLLALFRLTITSRRPFSRAEIIAGGFGMVSLIVLLLAVDGVGIYDIFLAFPLSYSATISIDEILCHKLPSDSSAKMNFFVLIRGFVFLFLLFAFHCTLGWTIKTFSPAFLRFAQPSAIPADESKFALTPKIFADDTSIVLEFPEEIGQNDNDHVQVTAITSLELPSKTDLHLFLSGNQQKRLHPEKDIWGDIPMEYTLKINGQPATSGPISTLSTPLFFTYKSPLNVVPQTIKIEMQLKCPKNWLTDHKDGRPVFAIEFPFSKATRPMKPTP
jgi:hypothetical protein